MKIEHEKRKRKKKIIFFSLVLLIIISVFLIGAYSEFRFKISKDLAKLMPSDLRSVLEKKLYVDNTIENLIKIEPKYSYNGDYDLFIKNFEEYKYKSIGFPITNYNALMNSDKLGEIIIINSYNIGDIEISNIKFPVVGEYLPGLIVRKKNQPINKVVIVVPGVPEEKNPLDDVIDKDSYEKGIALELAKENYTVFVPGLRGYNTGMDAVFFDEIVSMYSLSWLGFVASDALMLRNHIADKYNINPGEIGFVGISAGGAVSMFALAIDKDVPFAVINSFFGSFDYNFVKEKHSSLGRVNNVLNYFNMKDFLIAGFPRKIIVINGEFDSVSASNAKKEFESVKSFYEENNNPNAFFYSSKQTKHEYDIPLIKKILREI